MIRGKTSLKKSIGSVKTENLLMIDVLVQSSLLLRWLLLAVTDISDGTIASENYMGKSKKCMNVNV